MPNTLTGGGYAVTTSLTAGLTAGASEIITIIGCNIANVDATDACWVTVNVNRNSGTDTELAHQISIPVNDSLNPIQGKLVLGNSDALEFQAEANSKLEVTFSYLSQT